ncbi:hypothetical protein VV867_27520 [Pseudomonas sp. JH-2]|uniref:hypothetical protein n=1 Tax=Pseudomonas sp. JH-2 TaxID=3114998 RepID=UPI002E269D06|nr:hypothetical protein [Pseudomonas sp. JH-2]
MSGPFYPCTREDPMGRGPQGLLGEGELPWPEVVAARAFPSQINIGGEYVTDDYSGAMFLAGELATADSGMPAEEAEESLALLVFLFGKLKQVGKTSAKEMEVLRKQAEAIPVVGPLLFSPTNLPGTVLSTIGMTHSGIQTRKLIDLLDIKSPLKKELLRWHKTRGQIRKASTRKMFNRRIKLIYSGNALKFQIPASSTASIYRLGDLYSGGKIQVPRSQITSTLEKRIFIDSKMYGAKGFGKLIGSTSVGTLLSIGPQAYIDAKESKDLQEFLNRSAYSQVGNVAGLAAGVVVGLVGGPAILVIAGGLIFGMAAQYVIGESGTDKKVGDILTGKKSLW